VEVGVVEVGLEAERGDGDFFRSGFDDPIIEADDDAIDTDTH